MAKIQSDSEISLDRIHYVRVYPGIGIARVGDSEDEYFIGPETPGEWFHASDGDENEDGDDVSAPTSASYRDESGNLKRCGQRYRVYGFDRQHQMVGELSLSVSCGIAIDWRVHLANKKSGFFDFKGREVFDPFHSALYSSDSDWDSRADFLQSLRNSGNAEKKSSAVNIQANTHPNKRSELINDPGEVSVVVTSDNIKKVSGQFTPIRGGKIFGLEAPKLGDLVIDGTGRLIVLGGHGKSAHYQPNAPSARIYQYANNDGWYDDISDGPVNVQVTFQTSDGKKVTLNSKNPPADSITAAQCRGWCIVAPPKFAPSIKNVITLYDVIKETSILSSIHDPFIENIFKQNNEILSLEKVWFYRDIYPILSTLRDYSFVNDNALVGHGYGTRGDFLNDGLLTILSSNASDTAIVRKKVFDRMREPKQSMPPPSQQRRIDQSTTEFMPQLSGDKGDATAGDPDRWLTVTPNQYERLRRWSQSDFVTETEEQRDEYRKRLNTLPHSLELSALEWCVGGPFYPGIEMTYIATRAVTFESPFRITHLWSAGDVSRYMAVPWQSDFYECQVHWWPPQRPDKVLPEKNYNANPNDFNFRVDWARSLPANADKRDWTTPQLGDEAMVEWWSRLGFVVPRQCNIDPGRKHPLTQVLLETQRESIPIDTNNPLKSSANNINFNNNNNNIFTPNLAITNGSTNTITPPTIIDTSLPTVLPSNNNNIITTNTTDNNNNDDDNNNNDEILLSPSNERDAFYKLMNIDDNIDFLPTAKKMVEAYLRRTTNIIKNLNPLDLDDKILIPFIYTRENFEKRLMEIYNRVVIRNKEYDIWNETIFKTRDDVIARLIQLAPFNQTDGTWLRGVARGGPIDTVRSFLFGIWNDEMGNGNPHHNHCNIYTTLLKSLGVYLPELRDYAYSHDKSIGFAPHAFTVAVFQLCISSFSDHYLPEILGMTLQLEWTIVDYNLTIELLRRFGLDTHFYVLHVGIDNAANGHGKMAKDAVMHYLEGLKKDQMGSEEIQKIWRRIWRGYIAFDRLGSKLFDELQFIVQQKQLQPTIPSAIATVPSPPPPPPTYYEDIRPLFTSADLADFKQKYRINLWTLLTEKNARENAETVFGHLKSGDFPIDISERWNESRLALYRSWIDGGMLSGNELRAHCRAEILRMIATKAPFASLNHGSKVVGGKPIDQWFSDPPAFLDALIKAKYLIPGRPEQSPIIQKMSFETGPMFKVFTDNEITIWKQYIQSLHVDHIEPVIAAEQHIIESPTVTSRPFRRKPVRMGGIV